MRKQLYGVFGNPVAHSLSPQIHQMFAEQAGIDLDYVRIEAPLDGLRRAVQEFVESGANGFNVTLPFKEEAAALVASASPAATAAGAVNTVLVGSNGSLSGENTDGAGLVNDLTINLGWQVEDMKILLLGAGGAVKGVLGSLLEQKPARIVVANRTLPRAEALVKTLNLARKQDESDCSACGFDDLVEPFDLIINGTSASLEGNLPGIAAVVIGDSTCCYDMVYAATDTVFSRWAQNQGALQTADGLGMLVEQAALAFEFWTGFKVKTEFVQTSQRAILRT